MRVRVARDRASGLPTLIAARDGDVLVADDATHSPEERVRAFLATHGAVLGLSKAERAAPPFAIRATTGVGDGEVVRLAQRHRDLPVHGAELAVRISARGIASVAGHWVRGLDVDPTPRIALDQARARAAGALGRSARASDGMLAILPVGLARGVAADARLAWSVRVDAGDDAYQVWIDALDGRVLEQFSLHQHALFRRVRTGGFGHFGVEVANENDPPNLLDPDPIHRLFRFTGQTYSFFQSAFGRDGSDGAGRVMQAFYRTDCVGGARYGGGVEVCIGADVDDIVAHEWGHAYSDGTHRLEYGYEPGALNEAYSDIWGETLDLHNGEDGRGGGANAAPAPAGQRWLLGEDTGFGTRDMCNPERAGYPGYVTAETQNCAGGIGPDLAIPGHGYALLVDGSASCASAENVSPGAPTVSGIGFVKAAAIYYRAMTVYQTPTTGFAAHADALEASCADLVGADLTPWTIGGLTAGDATITRGDCDQVTNMIAAIGLRNTFACPVPDPYPSRFIETDPPPPCADGVLTFAQPFEKRPKDWTYSTNGVTASWPDKQWVVVNDLPDARPGSAALAPADDGDCSVDRSGSFAMTSPVQTAPAAGGIEVRFTHLFDSELFRDGGNLMLGVGGTFTPILDEHITYNAYTPWALDPADWSSNPKAEQRAWHGRESEDETYNVKLVWITTIVRLDQLVAPGQTYQLRWDFGQDACRSFGGWYVDDVEVYSCPTP